MCSNISTETIRSNVRSGSNVVTSAVTTSRFAAAAARSAIGLDLAWP